MNDVGTYTFANNYVNLVLTQQVPYVIDSVTRDSTLTRTYNIFDLTAASVELLTDTSAIYMSKNP